MNHSKVWRSLAVIGLIVAAFTSQAAAWEFMMNGDFVWQLESRGQWSSNGFFGQYDSESVSGVATVGAGLPGVFAPYNFWYGAGTPGNYAGIEIASGSDVSWNTQYMQTDLEVRINPAVRIRGRYYIGEWGGALAAQTGIGVASQYLNNRWGGIQKSFSPGYWNMLWLSAQLPWGELSVGKRPSALGMGLIFNGTESRSSESFAIAAPYGPLRIVLSFYPSRRGFNADYYNADHDKNATRRWEYAATLTYRQGPLDVGFNITSINFHRGGEGIINTPVLRQQAGAVGGVQTFADLDDLYGTAYVKYYTGRIFVNAEVGFDSITQRNTKLTAAGVPFANTTSGAFPHPAAYQRVHRNTYTEHWRAAAEISCLTGPAKTSILYGWSAGADRRAGSLIDRQGVLSSNGFANTGIYRPYSYLMVYSYGLGMFINGDTNNGYVEDASLWAARFDYAVAANLNLYGTFVYADRQSKSGFGWGCITPNPAVATGAVLRRGGFTGMAAERLNAPNIPDTNLGYEVDAGFSWKLLEGLTVNTTFAWWQPGDWFKWACIDRNVAGWGIAAPVVTAATANLTTSWGINPTRSIDPIWGLEMLLTGSF